MLPNPLHPMVVHFPVVLAFILPVLAVGALWAIRRGTNARRAWLIPLAGAALLAASAWLGVKTGESQDERVEQVVPEQPLESHEELAEVFLAASAIVTLVAAAGLVGGVAGQAARLATVLGALVLVGLVARVGHSGGELVYRYGAASAYAAPGNLTNAPKTETTSSRSTRERPEDEDGR